MPENDKISALRKKLIRKAKQEVKEKYSGKDVHIIKAVNILEDLDATFNLLSEQAREWYSVYFPELDRQVKSGETYLKLVFNLGERENFEEKKITEYYENKEKARRIADAAGKSIGSAIEKPDLAEIRVLALNALNIREERDFLAKYLEKSMEAVMPNFTALCGAVIGAKILAKAGSLRKLAIMPSSTIQVIGAEKALFQHLKTGSRPPKHGFLYQHPLVSQASRDNKGKVARALAGKLAIAAKKDYFGGKPSEELGKQLNLRIKEISAGKKKVRKKRQKQGRGSRRRK